MPVLFDKLAERFVEKRAGRVSLILDAVKRVAEKAIGKPVHVPTGIKDLTRKGPSAAASASSLVSSPVPKSGPTPKSKPAPKPEPAEVAKEKGKKEEEEETTPPKPSPPG